MKQTKMTLDDQIIVEYRRQLRVKMNGLSNLLVWSDKCELQKDAIRKELEYIQNLYDGLFKPSVGVY